MCVCGSLRRGGLQGGQGLSREKVMKLSSPDIHLLLIATPTPQVYESVLHSSQDNHVTSHMTYLTGRR